MFGIRTLALVLRRAATTPLSWYVVGLLCAFAALYVALGSASEATLNNIWFNADTLFPGHVGRDVVLDKNPASGWTFPVATFVFPDVVFSSLCSILIPHPAVAAFVYGVLQFSFVVAGFLLCCRSLELRNARLTYAGVLLGAIGITLLCALGASAQSPRLLGGFKRWDHFDFVTIQNLFLTQLHTGCFAVVLWCSALGLLLLKDGNSRLRQSLLAGALAILCALGCMGDLLFVVQFTAAFACACLLAAFLNWISWRRILVPVGCAAVGSWVGLRLEKMLFTAKAAGDMGAFTFESATKALDAYLYGLRETHRTHYNLLQWSASLWLLACLVLVLFAVRRQLTQPPGETSPNTPRLTPLFFAFLGISALGSAAAIIAGGHFYLAVYRDFTQAMKYQHTLFMMPFLGWGLVLSLAVAYCCRSERWTKRLLWAGAVVAVAGPVWFLASYARKSEQPPHAFRPAWVRELDRQAAVYDLHTGIADFWSARQVTLFSTHGLRALHAWPDLQPGFHLANRYWYTGDVAHGRPAPRFDFLIVSFTAGNGPHDLTKIRWSFGEPAAMVPLDKFRQLWVYNRPSDTAFREHFFDPSGHTPPGMSVTLAGAALPAESGVVEGGDRVARTGAAKTGLFTHGPDLWLPTGRYRVTAHLSADGLANTTKVGSWEVGCFQGATPILGGGGALYAGSQTIDVSLVIPDNEIRLLEMRTYYDGVGTLTVHDVRVVREE